MAVLCGMNTIQYSARRLSVHKLFTSCIRRCLVSRACDWVMSALSAVLLIFSFQFSLLFFYVSQPGSTAVYWFYQISDIGGCRKFGSVSCMDRPAQRNDFELILKVKMETKLDIGGLFGSEFPAICNDCVVMAARSRKTLKFCEKILRFWNNDPLR